ncbi:alpha/beta hydrolase [Vibrio campbellii]|uniref:alpha/beta hydrolase n=1 Tax=Vibrio campbellii TaxID=680 RepID=UPI00210AF249|nr:alpha/beta fold hydrolase [Vibrio campbellii]UTZ24722.1 alpha/beta hydrolase [Vibrio campbellii]|tara:strand:- start:25 stop:960 length:936 start_codon:yes stop_codon:yes gene_type:complete
MKYLFLSVVLTFSVVSTYANTLETIVSVKTENGELEGTLLTSEKNSKNHVALIIAGSGPTDRNGNNAQFTNDSLKMLAHALAKEGISSLRYDKRGVGKSKDAGLNESELRFEDYINDAKILVDYLDNQVGFKNIIVIGHSEGSLVGMVASQQKNVAKFVSIAGAGQPIDQTIREQLKAQPPGVLEQSTPILDKLSEGKTVDNVPPFLNSLFRPSIQPYMISWFKYNPQKEIAKLNKPVMIIQGNTDIQVSIKDANKLASANKKSQKVIIKKMNHIFKEAPLDTQDNFKTYNQPELPIKSELVQAISQFVKY